MVQARYGLRTVGLRSGPLLDGGGRTRFGATVRVTPVNVPPLGLSAWGNAHPMRRDHGGMTTPILACKGCGRTKSEPTGAPDDLFPTEHCGECPPWTCETCGEPCSAASLCSCWLSLEGLALAD